LLTSSKSLREITIMTKTKSTVKPKQVNLALQGGGSHGAFTWPNLNTSNRQGFDLAY
jgi:predicted acylesterase/phospholipase RssA